MQTQAKTTLGDIWFTIRGPKEQSETEGLWALDELQALMEAYLRKLLVNRPDVEFEVIHEQG